MSLLVLVICQLSFTPKVHAITVDGNFGDWASISPVVTDPIGDGGI